VVDDFVAVGVYRGRPAVRAFFTELFAAFPDFRVEIDRSRRAARGPSCSGSAAGPSPGARSRGCRRRGRTSRSAAWIA
jgi:hypothetical protein